MRKALFCFVILGIIALLLSSGEAYGLYVPQDASEPPVQWGKVDERLRARLADLDDQTRVELILRLSPRADLEEVQFQRDAVVQRLKAAAGSQDLVVDPLAKAGFSVLKRFWIMNALLVEGPPGQVGDITKLAQVQRILDNFDVSLVDGEPISPAVQAEGAVTWGLEKVGSGRVWSEFGVEGDGVRVCVSDTGVDISHPDLSGRMWSDISGNLEFPGGWIEFDSAGNPVLDSTPHDTQGHGTHTSGTVLGGQASGIAIGMAPRASLMHALVLPGGGGSFSQVIAGIEWCVSPTDDQGNPAGQPADVHSMSWGASGYYSNEMVDPLRNSYFAGTVPVAAAGNCGLGCTGSPGNSFDALAIGASDVDDLIASFSSGEVVQKLYWSSPPADWPEEWMVPLISAPGVSVLSSLPGGTYQAWSGTSMATPHVAGCSALMRSANPTLTPADIRNGLVNTARWFDTYQPSPPDPRYGWGRMDCFAAVESVAFDSGIRGTLRDQQDGEPVDQAQINISAMDGARQVQSDPTGAFIISLRPGTYNLSLERFGYSSLTRNNITVLPDQWEDLLLDLVPLPRGNVTGKAIHNVTGIEIPGVNIVLDVPITIVSITDGNGTFSLQKVPEGTYGLEARSPYFLDEAVTGIAVVRDASTTVDFLLDPRDQVAVMGDRDESLSSLLRENGYYVENPDWWEVLNDPCRYRTVVVNHPPFPGTTTFNDFIAATDTVGTGVVFLDTWQHTFTGGGIYYLWSYLSDPPIRGYSYDTAATQVRYNVTQSHPILGSSGPGDLIVLENRTYWHDNAWFDLYTGENGTVIAQAATDSAGDLGQGIAVDNRANNRHVLLSLHGASFYVTPNDWTPEGTDVFLNAVDWAKGTPCSSFLAADFDLAVNPPEGLWSETFQVSIRAKNVGTGTGNYTASLYVDGFLAGQQTTSLLSGETKVVTLSVSRDPVGTYVVSVGPHTTTFRVRPPTVTVQATDLDGTSIAGGTVLVGLGNSLVDMGGTDENGSLTFDSPTGSHGQYWVVLQAQKVGTGGPHYFLAENLSVEDDLAVSFLPTANSTSRLNVAMEGVVAGQEGVVYVRRTDMPSAFSEAFPYEPGPILVDPAAYEVRARTMVSTLQSTWEIQTATATLDLVALPTATFRFGGPLELNVSWSQVGSSASIDWSIRDASQNSLVGVVERRVGILAPENATSHLPFLSLWDAQGVLLSAGFVDWTQRPADVTLAPGQTLAFVHVDLETGGYPFENTFVLETEVLDTKGRVLPPVAATPDTSIEIRGSVLRSGLAIPVNLTVNGLAVAVGPNGTFSAILNLTEGMNTLAIVARDLAGHESSETFVILSKPNVLLSVSPLPALTTVPTLTIQGVVESGATLRVNGLEPPVGADGAFSVTLELSEGLNTIVVSAVDYLGTQKEIVREVILDTLPPEIRIITPSPGYVTRDESLLIAGETEEGAILTINDVPVAIEGGAFAYTANLSDGENLFLVRATDGAGNNAEMTLLVHREPLLVGVPLSTLWLALPIGGATGVAAFALLFLWRRWRARGAKEPEPAGESTLPKERQ